ncbi:MAG: hypothetical protein CMB78_02065 [Euryarchaeota archaeon]|nr:hypothetical protein [Euryarchaeota archaeon]|tara:strand:- start:227 stop:1474 length:1248 start_codon:yes stop_codon:yes gene_type:complete
MAEWKRNWRPAAMTPLESDNSAPKGFEKFTFAGIGMKCSIIEPKSLSKTSDWASIVSELEQWGEVPDTSSLQSISISEDESGPIAILHAGSEWFAEFLPWGSDGMLRRRSESASEICDAPCGGYSWEGIDIMVIRKNPPMGIDSDENLREALQAGEVGVAREILGACGKSLGLYHQHVNSERVTPADPIRWNQRLAGIEESLRAHSMWRAPHSRDAECMLGLGSVRFQDFKEGKIRIGRPRLSDALFPPKCEFPAIRDLASLVHDLSRIHHNTACNLDIVDLRSALIGGWRESAPSNWSSDSVFYTHRGGLAIWEYEQCLLDVVEAVSNQSGAPQPSTNLISYVRPFQKRMFNNRTIAALSVLLAFLGASSLANTFPFSGEELPIPLACFLSSAALMRYYRRLAPPPEMPFSRFF